MHVETLGSGPRIVLVHGSVAPGWMTWNAQKPLADRFTLVVPVRSGYPPNPPLESIDFEDQAAELREVLEPGDHLVGHSYGGVVSLLAAPGAELGSLTVLEPPAFGVARATPRLRSSSGTSPTARRRSRASTSSSSCRSSDRHLRAVGPTAAGARGRRPRRDRGAHAGRGGDPLDAARGRAVPEARRLRRAQRGVRRRLRRARGAPRRAAGGPRRRGPPIPTRRAAERSPRRFAGRRARRDEPCYAACSSSGSLPTPDARAVRRASRSRST